MTTAYAVGTSKQDIALAAVIAHPGVTSLEILEYAPSLGPQVKAAGLLHELHLSGRVERRPGRDLWTWWPKTGAASAELYDEPEPRDIRAEARSDLSRAGVGGPKKRNTQKFDRALTAVAEHAGRSAKELCAVMPELGAPGNLVDLLNRGVALGRLEKRRGGGWGKEVRFWPAGQVPAQAPLVKPAPKPAPKPAKVAAPPKARRPRRSPQRDQIIRLVKANPGLGAADIGKLALPPLKPGSVFAQLFFAQAAGQLSRARRLGVWAWWPAGQAPADDGLPPKRMGKSMPLAVLVNRGESITGDFGVDVDAMEALCARA